MTIKKPLPLLDSDDPEAKLRFIKQYGPEAYETALRDWQQRNTMTTVNGYPIRRVNTRFGGMLWSTAPSMRLRVCPRPRRLRVTCPPVTNLTV